MSYPTGYLAILELKKMTIGFSESGKTFGPSVLFTLNLWNVPSAAHIMLQDFILFLTLASGSEIQCLYIQKIGNFISALWGNKVELFFIW